MSVDTTKYGFTEHRYTRQQVELLWMLLREHLHEPKKQKSYYEALTAFGDLEKVAKVDLFEFWLPMAESFVGWDSFTAFWDRLAKLT